MNETRTVMWRCVGCGRKNNPYPHRAHITEICRKMRHMRHIMFLCEGGNKKKLVVNRGSLEQHEKRREVLSSITSKSI